MKFKSEDVFSVVGRSLLAAIFLSAGMTKLRDAENTRRYMKSKNLPMVALLRPLAAGLELSASLSLVLGYKPRLGAAAAIAYLIPTTLIFHDFWNLPGREREIERANFMKNLAIIGGLVKFVEHGTGPVSMSTVAAGGDPLRELRREVAIPRFSA